MQGEPEWFNTKTDLENWRTIGGEEAYKASIQKLYDARMIWVSTAENIEGDGVTDATHQVIENRNMETNETVRHQQELQADPNAYIFTRLGFTDGECRAILEV
jgi:hypothetical protein